MSGFFRLTSKKQKKLQRFFSVFTILSLILQIGSGVFLYNPAFAEEEATPQPEADRPLDETPTPTIEVTPQPEADRPLDETPTIEPTPSVEPEITPTPIPTEEVSPTPPVENNQPASENSAPPSETGPPAPSLNETSSATPSENTPTPTVTVEQPTENGQLNAIILENVAASSLELDLATEDIEQSASLVTDKADYAPTDTVLISGSDFNPNETYTLIISSSDEPPVNFETQVTADENGTFVYAYQLDGTYRPNYKVEAKDSSGAVLAITSFTDDSPAGLPFSDSFGSSNQSDVPNWDEHNPAEVASGSGEDSPRSGSPTPQFAKIGDGGWICRTINASGYQSLQLKYYWKGDADAENDDHGIVEYRTGGDCSSGSGWSNITSNELNNTSWDQKTHSLPASLNNGTFRIRFRTDASSNEEHFRVDDVEITGSQVQHIQVTLCHAKPSDTAANGYDKIITDDDGIFQQGHDSQHDADIIPPFDYYGGHYNGKNWTTTGQAIYNNGCNIPSDLKATKTNNLNGGNADVGQTFTWKIKVENIGQSNAHFDENEIILTDNLPDSNVTYGIPTVTAHSNVTGDDHIQCSISSNNLICKVQDNKSVTIDGSGYFEVSFTVKFSAANTYTNPRSGSGNKCQADPNNHVHELDETNNDCLNTVTVVSVPICGDGVVNQQSEECDGDSPRACTTTSGYAGKKSCNAQCTWNSCETSLRCGDGRVDGLEVCDEGDALNGTYSHCKADCTGPGLRCGDGITTQPQEQCDDSNTTNGDGCSATCQIEYGSIALGKCNDINGDGGDCFGGEPMLPNWTLFLDENGDGILNGGERNGVTDSNGMVYFNNVLPRNYGLCEVEQSGWIRTRPQASNCLGVTLNPGGGVVYYFANRRNPVTIKAYKVVCNSEADLPNWGGTDGSGINATTAQNFVNSHPNCHLESGWDFQWGFNDKAAAAGVDKLMGNHIGPANGTPSTCPPGGSNCGPNTNTGTGYNDWKNFDTSSGGATPAQVVINNLEGAPGIWVRENLKTGYVPFTYPPKEGTEDNVSAEIYCHNDVYKYDNYDLVDNPQNGNTYYCVAFNASNYGSITIRKDSIPNHEQDFNFTRNFGGSFILDDDSNATYPNNITFNNLPPGNYTVTEENSNWQLTNINCTGGQTSRNGRTININLSPGDNVSCTFVNVNGVIVSYKYNDLDNSGHFDTGEPRLDGWLISLYDSNWNFLKSMLTGDDTTEAGNVEPGHFTFKFLVPGIYYVCETLQSGWIQTEPTTGPIGDGTHCRQVNLSAGGLVYGIPFGNLGLGEIKACKYDDYDGDQGKDAPIAGVTMTLEKQTLCEVAAAECPPVWLPVASGDTKGDGCYNFTGLEAGHYRVSEDLTDLPGYNPTSPSSVETDVATSGQIIPVDFFNELQPVKLSLDKSNNKPTATGPGDTVTYTLVVTNNSEITAYDATLRDVLPYGFTYVIDSGSVDGAPVNPSISGSVLTWTLGDISVGGSRTIIYQAKTDSGLETGSYTNIAVAYGYNRVSGAADREKSESNIDDSLVKLAVGLGFSATVGGTVGTVLGAATQVLGAATGSPTIWLILALLMLASGLTIRYWKKIKKGLMLSLIFFIFVAGSAQAAVQVSITDLPDYLNHYDFKVYYTALDTAESPTYSVSGWMHKEGQAWKQFDVTLTIPSGFFQAKGEYFDGEGKYYFQIRNGSGDNSGEEVVTIDFSGPDAPRDYNKSRLSSTEYKISWRNPSNSDFDRVYVYRSDKRDFTADGSTQIGQRGGSPDNLMDYVDSGLEPGKEYFYALRAIDKAGNASGLTGDGGSVTYIEITPTPGPGQVTGVIGGVKVLPKEEKGEILGGATEAPTPTEAAGGLAGAVAGIATEGGSKIWLFGLGGLAILAIIGYFFYRRRS